MKQKATMSLIISVLSFPFISAAKTGKLSPVSAKIRAGSAHKGSGAAPLRGCCMAKDSPLAPHVMMSDKPTSASAHPGLSGVGLPNIA